MSLQSADYAEPAHPGEEQDDRARRHREQAIQALDDRDRDRAVVHILSAIEARLDELAVHIARLS